MLDACARTPDEGRAFEALYVEHSADVYQAALRILGNATLAQDVVQDVYMRLWLRPERFDAARGTLRSYLLLMARSRALDIWREGQVAGRAWDRMHALAQLAEARAEELPVRAAELHRDQGVVLAALTHLPEPQREAIVMADWGGLTADEIATCSGVAVGTVKSRIRLGLLYLRKRCERPLAVAA